MDFSLLTDPHTLYVVAGLILIALLRYALRTPPAPRAAGKRFVDIQRKAREEGAQRRIKAEEDADKIFDDQEKEEAKLC
jgi:hypothetical protein